MRTRAKKKKRKTREEKERAQRRQALEQAERLARFEAELKERSAIKHRIAVHKKADGYFDWWFKFLFGW